MQDDLKELFIKGGCIVTLNGVICGGKYRFGIITDFEPGLFIADDGTRYKPTWACISDDRCTLTIESNGSTSVITGDIMAKEDKRLLPNGGKMPSSISQLEDMFHLLYPNADDQVYTDEVSERPFVDMAMFGKDSGGFIPITDKLLAIYHADIERRLDDLGLEGKYPIYKIRDEMLDILIGRNRRNLFRDWVESHTWDGIPRLRTWFQDTFGATAPALSSSKEDEDEYLGAVAEAWFIGAIRRMYLETKHEVVPVLIGGQGIMKGTAIQYTAGSDEWYVECNEDVKQVQKFLEATRGRIIVELSEATQIRGPDVEALKAFISKSEDQLRKPYAHFEESFPRHFILIASTNIDNIFTDITGNRRFFPMYCDPDRATREFSVDRTVGQYDVEQVWAEALELYNNGHKWYIPPSVIELSRTMQEFYTQENSNISVIEDWLDNPAHGYTNVGSLISKNNIMEEIFNAGILPSKEFETSYRAWTNATTSWKKRASPVRINGKVTRVYERIKGVDAPTEKPKRLKVVDGMTGLASAEERLKEQAHADGLTEGMAFRPRNLPPEMLEKLCEEGYIYYITSIDGRKEWHIGEIPGEEA